MTNQHTTSLQNIAESKRLITRDVEYSSNFRNPETLHRSDNYDDVTIPNNGSEDEAEDPWEATFKDRRVVIKRLASFLMMMTINVGLPLALYYGTRDAIGILYALLLSGAPPLIHTIYVFIRRRRVDVLGTLMVIAFIVSAIISIITGDVRAALLRDSAVTALVSLLFFVTLFPIKNKWMSNRPLTFSIASQMMFDEAQPYNWVDKYGERHELPMTDWVWSMPKTRKIHYITTAGWSLGLMSEFIIRVIMVEATSLTVDQIILYGNIIVIAVVVVMSTFSIYGSFTSRKEIRQWIKDNNYAIRKNSSRQENVQ